MKEEILRALGRWAGTPWGLRTQEAVERGAFSGEDIFDAEQWGRCACAYLYIPKDICDGPENDDLANLGLDFMCAVRHNEALGAANILRELYDLAVELYGEDVVIWSDKE